MQRTASDQQKATLFLIAASILVFLPFLGAAGMFDPTDSFFMESAREMLEKHVFAFPLINYAPWLDKPALAFWFIALSDKMLGLNEFAGRLPSALGGITTVLITYLFCRKMLLSRQALLAAMVMLSLPLFIIVGHVSLLDEILTCFLTASLLSFAQAAIKKSQPSLWAGYIFLALAFLCKGPLAIVFVGTIMLIYLVIVNRQETIAAIVELKPLSGLALFLILTLPYYIWAHIASAGAFTKMFFLRQYVGRLVGALNHVRPFWFYIPIAIAGFFPWSFTVCLAVPFLSRCLKRVSTSTGSCSISDRQKLIVFVLCWIVLGFVLFSCVPTKLETYIVPIMPGFAIVIGCLLDLIVRRRHTGPIFFISSLFAAGLLACPIIFYILFRNQHALLFIAAITAAASIIALLSALKLVKAMQLRSAIVTICSIGIFACAVYTPLYFFAYHHKYQTEIDSLVNYARQNQANLAMVNFLVPSAIYRYQRQLPLIQNQKEMRTYADASPDRQWILINKDILSLLYWTERSPRVVAHNGAWWLFAVGKNCRQENTVEWNGLAGHQYPSLK